MFDLPHMVPYGSWQSPITFEMVASDSINMSFVDIDRDSVFYDELRVKEGGRVALVKQKFDSEEQEEVTPQTFNIRTRANEYGGKSFFLKNKDIFCIEAKDQRIYKINSNGKIEPITEDNETRYADLIFDERRECIYCIQEEHKEDGVFNSLIKIDLKTKNKTVLEAKKDFYASLTLSPDGKKIAYICWDLPNLPWEGSELILREIDEKGNMKDRQLIAGGRDESIFQPSFSSDNILYFVSDRTGFYNLYCYGEGVRPLYPINAEFGVPQWQFGLSTYCFVEKGEGYAIFCSLFKKDKCVLLEIDPYTKKTNEHNLPFSFLLNLRSNRNKIVFIGATEKMEKSVVLYDVKSDLWKVLKRPRKIEIDEGYISFPKLIEIKGTEDKIIYAYLYLPQNADFVAPKDELPPLIVRCHGGPTGQTFPILNLDIQFWTSRGFALCDVNYSGSSGYGKEYRKRLDQNWGISDVEDCANAALMLAQKKIVDGDRLIIKGASAGGFTALAALAFKNVFKGGVSYFGVTDLEEIVKHTHKFESGYFDHLIGPYPEEKERYYNRSPVNFVDQIKVPVLLLQGKEDKIVPMEQAEKIYSAMIKNKVPVAYLLFDKEGHGFRDGKNIKRALEAELFFYSKIFGFPTGEVPFLKIENMP